MPEAIRQQLTQRYAESHRAYRGIGHIETLLQGQFAHRDLIKVQRAVMLAIWFHNAIYDTHQHDNEERCAALAGEMLTQAGAEPALIESVQRKVRATRRHEWTDGDPDTAVFLDLDLGILAASPEAYDRYAGRWPRSTAGCPSRPTNKAEPRFCKPLWTGLRSVSRRPCGSCGKSRPAPICSANWPR